MYDNVDFRIIDTERKILDIVNNCGLSIVTISMILKGISQSVDIKKFEVIQSYNKKVNEDGNSTEDSD